MCEKSRRIRKLFTFGIAASLLTVLLGEIPLGWVVNPPADNEMLSALLGYASLTTPQLACGVFFGAIGIPLQYYGYKAVAELLSDSGCGCCAHVTEIGAKAIAFGGAAVHVICVALMYLCKMEAAALAAGIPQSVMTFSLWLVLPFSAVFMVVYTAMSVAMSIPIAKGKTLFPKWAVVFNPLAAKVLIPAAAMLLPNTEPVNALNMADMGIGSLITFVGLLALYGGRES